MRRLAVWLSVGFIFFLGCRSVTGPTPGMKETSVDLGGGVKMEFVWIEALTCWVGKYEVTNEEYRRYRKGHDSGDRTGFSLNGDRQPVAMVSYDDSVAYAEWMNRTCVLPPGYKARLPHAKQWPTYAQCGDGRKYPWGNEWPPKYGNYGDRTMAKATGWDRPLDGYDDASVVSCPVELSGKNEWGLYGVGGNVWEWTREYSDVLENNWRVLRGGAWTTWIRTAVECAYRDCQYPSVCRMDRGFRLVLVR